MWIIKSIFRITVGLINNCNIYQWWLYVNIFQMTCDTNFMATNCVARWPGSCHDSRVFRESTLCHEFENGVYIFFKTSYLDIIKFCLLNSRDVLIKLNHQRHSWYYIWYTGILIIFYMKNYRSAWWVVTRRFWKLLDNMYL